MAITFVKSQDMGNAQDFAAFYLKCICPYQMGLLILVHKSLEHRLKRLSIKNLGFIPGYMLLLYCKQIPH